MAFADMTSVQFDAHLAGLSQSTLALKKSSYDGVKTSMTTEATTLDGKRGQLHAHQVKVDAMLGKIATLQAHEDARFADFESRIAALEVS